MLLNRVAVAFIAYYIKSVTCEDPEQLNQKGENVYNANWESLDTRPLPAWYDAGKIGVMVTWGPYSVPGVGSEWFWWALRGIYSLNKNNSYWLYVNDN